MQFEMTDEQTQKFKVWAKEIGLKGAALQKESIKEPDSIYEWCWEQGVPYTGAIGGEFTFEFTPTSMGTCLEVRDSVTGEKINLTDYESW